MNEINIKGKCINVILKVGITNLIFIASLKIGSINFSTTKNEIKKSASPTIKTAQKDDLTI